MIRRNLPQLLLAITYWRPGEEITDKALTAAEAAKFVEREFDHVLAPIWGLYAYRTADGKWSERPLRRSGMGTVALGIIQALQVNAGVVQTRGDISVLINDDEYCGDWPLPARMRVIRAAHGESGSRQRMFLSDPSGGYYWPKDLSWCWVEKAPPVLSSNGKSE